MQLPFFTIEQNCMTNSKIRSSNAYLLTKIEHSKNTIGDDDFTITEIENQMVTLKDNKASSTAIINEMIKADPKLMAQTLCHIFNQILAKGIYPHRWHNSDTTI